MAARGVQNVETIVVRFTVEEGVVVGVSSVDGELVLVDRVPRRLLKLVPGDGCLVLDFSRGGALGTNLPVNVDVEGGTRGGRGIFSRWTFGNVVVGGLDAVVLAILALEVEPADLSVLGNFLGDFSHLEEVMFEVGGYEERERCLDCSDCLLRCEVVVADELIKGQDCWLYLYFYVDTFLIIRLPLNQRLSGCS